MTPRVLATFLGGMAAGVGCLTLAGVALWFAWRAMARRAERALGQLPSRSPIELFFGLRSHSPGDVLLTLQRAEQAEPAQHPMGSQPQTDWLSQIGFDPATLFPGAAPGDAPVDLTTVLGQRARKPLRLALPVLIAPMGYGIGLNFPAKVALAEAASVSGTAVATGEGPYLPEERALADRWILQISRGRWAHQAALVRLADMVTVQLGQASEAGIAVVKSPSELPVRARKAIGGQAVIRATGAVDWEAWLPEIREANPDCPLSVKIPATQHLEEDLTRLAQLDFDVVVVDGNAGGSAGSPAVISDHAGIEVALATFRARRWIARHAPSLSLVVAGGVHGAADVAKLLALGADAVEVGSSLLFALSHEQVARVLPWQPPTRLVLAAGQGHAPPPLDRDLAAEHAANWFQATRQELMLMARALGVVRIHDLAPAHLVAHSADAAKVFGLRRDTEAQDGPSLARGLTSLVEEYQTLTQTLTEIEQTLSVSASSPD